MNNDEINDFSIGDEIDLSLDIIEDRGNKN
jgi:hypothetical protein